MRALSLVDLAQMTQELVPSATPQIFPRPPLQVVGVAAHQLDQLADALSYISSDVPRGNGTIIGSDESPEEGYWIGVIFAARRSYGPAAEEVVRQWSKASPRYTDDGFDKAWDAFEADHPRPVTVGSVFQLAELNGWRGRVTCLVLPEPSISRYALLDRAAIIAIPKMEWRLKGLFPTKGVGAMYGPSGSGKSFLVLDLGISIALGLIWFGYRTVACPVTYVMLEGEGALRNRINAWETHNQVQIPENFYAITQAVNLSTRQDVEDLAACLPKGGVLIIDTLNRAAPGQDENSSKDMGITIAGLKRLEEVTGGLVLVVHHTGKEVSKGMRGHSSLHAALDAAIEVERSGSIRAWNAAKVKDGADGQAVAFKLTMLALGTDDDGDTITSCVIDADPGAVFTPKAPSGSQQRLVLSAVRRALRESSRMGIGGCGPETPCMKVEDAIDGAASELVTGAKSKRRNRAGTIVRRLIGQKHLLSGADENEELWLWSW
jgi:hypothetical protein